MDDQAQRAAKLRTLSRKEREVLDLLCDGLLYQEVADQLNPPVTVGTVYAHYARICEKLGIRNRGRSARRAELAAFCPVLPFVFDDEPPEGRGVEPDPEPIPPQAVARYIDADPPIPRNVAAVVPYDPIPDPGFDTGDEVVDGQFRLLPPPNPWIRIVLGGGIGVIVTALVFVFVVPQIRGGAGQSAPAVVRPTPAAEVQAITPTSAPTRTATPTAQATATATPQLTRTPTPQPTATPRPVIGTFLYEADWSNGPNGWPLSFGWRWVSGMLVNDGSYGGDGEWVTPPYQPRDLADYAVEAEIQLVRDSSTYSYGIVVRDGYQAGIRTRNFDPFFALFTQRDGPIAERRFNPQPAWSVYRVEVKGNTIRVMLDGATMIDVTDNRFLSGGRVGLWSRSAQVNVRSFKVIAQ